jgi:hypothetical protein
LIDPGIVLSVLGTGTELGLTSTYHPPEKLILDIYIYPIELPMGTERPLPLSRTPKFPLGDF